MTFILTATHQYPRLAVRRASMGYAGHVPIRTTSWPIEEHSRRRSSWRALLCNRRMSGPRRAMPAVSQGLGKRVDSGAAQAYRCQNHDPVGLSFTRYKVRLEIQMCPRDVTGSSYRRLRVLPTKIPCLSLWANTRLDPTGKMRDYLQLYKRKHAAMANTHASTISTPAFTSTNLCPSRPKPRF